MKRFVFRLENMLKFQRQLEKQAEQRQQQALFELEAARSDVGAIEGQLMQTASYLRSQILSTRSAPLRDSGFRHLERINFALDNARDNVETAEKALLELTHKRAQAASHAKVLEMLRQHKWEAHRLADQRTVQLKLDETAMRMWGQASPKPR